MASVEDAELSYGLRPDGSLAHVSQVVSGLACDCVCPGCRLPLVARKGRILRHHFAHHVDRDCTAAWETTLHLLAKETLDRARTIRLPAVVAAAGDLEETVSPATDFRYEAVEIEMAAGSIRPDAVLVRGPRRLAVEVAVTHFSEPAKLAALREMDLPAIEIDLSRVPRHASRDAHEEMVLRTAPRAWLHNARLVEAEERLSRLVAREAEDAAREAARRLDRMAAAVRAEHEAPPLADLERWLERVRMAGLSGEGGIAAAEGRCFRYPAATWRAAFLDFAVLQQRGATFTLHHATSVLAGQGLVKEAFVRRRPWPEEDVEGLRLRIPGFRLPSEDVAAFADALVDAELLIPVRSGGWRCAPDRVLRAQESLREGTEYRERRGRLVDAVHDVFPDGLPEGFDIGKWGSLSLTKEGLSPQVIARDGGETFELLVEHLRSLAAMVRPGGSPPKTPGLANLPLERIRAERVAEAALRAEREREEEARRAESNRLWAEQQVRDRAMREAEESLAFVDRALRAARDEVGGDAVAWLRDAVATAVGRPFEEASACLDVQARERIEADLDRRREAAAAARRAEERRRAAEAKAAAELARVRAALEAAARARIPDPRVAAIWLDSTNPSLRKRPRDYCVDDRTLARCVDLLDALRKGGARRR